MVRLLLVAGAACAGILTLAVPSGAAIAAEESTASLIEEVIVTGRRREESQQDVPLSVTAFSGEAIERLKPQTLRDFDGLAPNVYLGMNTAGPGASALFIRGLGYADIEKTQTPQVGVIVDGIQMGSSTGQLVDVFDVQSIEINRGPQGVLFGKNTIGGNIIINRVKPEFNEWGYKIGGDVGNFDSTGIRGRINIPIIDDQLALKVGATKRDRDGYYDNETLGGSQGDVDSLSGTAALRWEPTDNFAAVLTYDYVDDSSDTLPQDPRFNGDQPFENLANKREPSQYNVDQVGLVADWGLTDNITLHSITGWHDSMDKVNQDFDGATVDSVAIPFAQLHTLRQQFFEVLTQEVRLDFDLSEEWAAMVGIYYYDSDLDFNQKTNNILQLPPVALGLPAGVPCAAVPVFRPHPLIGDLICQVATARSTQVASEEVESWSYFGSLTWRPTAALEFTVGARYIDEEKTFDNAYFDHTDGTFDTQGVDLEFDFSGRPNVPGNTVAGEDDWDDTIFMASGSWQFVENHMAYASYSEGFRSGGFSIRSAGDPSQAAFDPEDAWQAEVGIKNEFFSKTLRVNLAYFFLERDAAQFSSIIPLPPGSIPGTTTIINNGGKAEYQGLELETLWAINDSWALIFNAGWLDVDNKAFALPCEIIDGCVTGVPGVLDPPGTPRELGGNDDSRQPEWNYNFQISYDQPIGPGHLFANVGWKEVGEFLLVNTGGGADQRLIEDGYGQLDARVGYEWMFDSGDSLSVTAFGKNLTDEEWREQALFLGGFRTGFQGWGAPQIFALEFTYNH